MLMYIGVKFPNEQATHIKVAVRHRNKQVQLDVDPVVIGGGFIRQAFRMTSRRKSTCVLADMPRKAPRRFKEYCDGTRSAVMDRKNDALVWSMIREAAAEVGVLVPEDGILDVDIRED